MTTGRPDAATTAHRVPFRGGAAHRLAPAFWVLVLLSGVSALATDMYLPALPALGADLATGAVGTQLTLTAFLVGLAGGQLALGPVSDAVGRRPMLLAGPLVFLLASVVCTVAPTVEVLVVARFVQGVAGAAGAVCARAVVGDVHRGDEAASRYALLMAIGLLGPVVAPAVGAVVVAAGGWRATFALLVVVGLVQLLGVWRAVPESLPVEERQAGSVRATLARMADLLVDRRFRAHVVVACLATVGFFSYIGGSSLVLQDVYGIAPSTYALVFATNGVAMASASFAVTRLVRRWRPVVLRRAGLVLATTSSVLLLASSLLAGPLGADGGVPPFALVWVLLAGLTGGMGLVLPMGLALAQEAGRRSRGTASALGGGLAFSCGAVVIPLTGALSTASVVPMAALMAVGLGAALVASRWAPA